MSRSDVVWRRAIAHLVAVDDDPEPARRAPWSLWLRSELDWNEAVDHIAPIGTARYPRPLT